jgi:bla regulator protein BlaR1
MIPAFLQNELVRAFCWTLIHSLWQGLILAAVTGIVLILTRRSHAKKRYGLLSMLFFLFLVVTVITFVREVSLAKPAAASPALSEQLLPQLLTADGTMAVPVSNLSTNKQGLVQRFVDYFNTHAAMVVTIWFIIFFAKLIRLGGNLFYIQRLRSYKTQEPADEWKERIKQLADKLGVGMQIRLLESAIVKVPVTMGMFRPMILLPVGLLAHLPADEIEAILLHELAHIKRRDYFVNLLQSLAETIFFFNPALLWLSSMIRDERENCCDDIAISVTNNKTNFINALISFQEYHFAKPQYGMAFPGKKQQLLNRVKRIVNNSNKTLNAAEKSVLGFGMALLLLLSFVTAQKTQVKPIQQAKALNKPLPALRPVSAEKTVSAEVSGNVRLEQMQPLNSLEPLASMVIDTVPADPATKPATGATPPTPPVAAAYAETARLEGKMQIKSDTNQYKSISVSSNTTDGERTVVMTVVLKSGHEYRVKKFNDVVKEFAVDGKAVPESELGNYQQEIEMVEIACKQKRVSDKVRSEKAWHMKYDAVARQNEAIDKHKQQSALRLQKIKEEHVERDLEKQIHLNEKKKNEVDKQLHLQKERIQHQYDSSRKQGVDHSIAMEQKRKEFERVAVEHKKDLQKHIDIRKLNQLDLKKQKLALQQTDSLRKLSLHKPKKLFEVKKDDWMRARKEEDDARMKASAAVMRNIIDDLEKENVKVDLQKGWFALDGDRLVVDGKDLTKEQHEKFKSKYLNKSGWGYYYGNVQVSGKGIFLSNRDVPAK